MKLSIIIPMYNCEKYIADCLDSIINSGLSESDYEVIVVNDGSKDHGPEIAQSYAARHNHIRYLTQENQGQSVARNYGLTAAQGEYVWFVDGDDKVTSQICSVLDELEELGKPDVYSFFLKYVSEECKFLTKAFTFPGEYNKLMMGREAILCGYQPSSVCVCVMKRNFVLENNLRFYPGILQEDSEFSYRMMAYARQVYFSEYIPYIYIKHPNSSVTSTSPEKILKKQLDDVIVLNSFKKLSACFESTDYELANKISNHVKSMAFGCVYNLFRNRKTWRAMGINKVVLAKLKEEGYYPLHGPYGSWKKILAAMLLNCEFLIK